MTFIKNLFLIAGLLVASILPAQIITDNMGTTTTGTPPTPFVSPGATYAANLTQVGYSGGNRYYGSSGNGAYGYTPGVSGVTAVTLTLTFTVSPGKTVNVPSLTFQAQRNTTGPASLAVKVNTTSLSVSGAPGANVLAPVSATGGPSNLSGTVTINFEFSGANPTFTNWTARIDDLSVTGAVLPVELTNFETMSVEEKVQVRWATASERNNDFFAVERSQDGRSFRELAQVKGAGNSLTPQTYTYTDLEPANGVNYYRLRQVDFDGVATYSPVRSIRTDLLSKVNIAPNPASSAYGTIRYQAANEASVQVIIRNSSGQLMSENTYSAQKGENNISISGETWPPGVYTVQIWMDSVPQDAQQWVIR